MWDSVFRVVRVKLGEWDEMKKEKGIISGERFFETE